MSHIHRFTIDIPDDDLKPHPESVYDALREALSDLCVDEFDITDETLAVEEASTR